MSDGTRVGAGGSASLDEPDYWWYRARAKLLRTVFDPALASSLTFGARVLDVGSADGPSDFWTDRSVHAVSVDPDLRGLSAGSVCAALPDLPFPDESFDVVSAFDVIEHCADEAAALDEVHRVLRPDGLFLMAVPAYRWAWTAFDVRNGHYRRYTRRRAATSLTRCGFTVLRSTHAFAAVFPMFAADRLRTRLAESRHLDAPDGPADVVPVPHVSAPVETMLMRLCQLDARMLRSWDLPFGSSVFVAARRSGSLTSRPSPSSAVNESEPTM